jgi:hypothetical protein
LSVFSLSGQIVVSIILGILILKTYRWMRAQSALAAGLLAIGIIGRAAIGLTLFWISYLDLALLNGLHSGDGFWRVASDAGTYYHAASIGYLQGLSAIPSNTPSPAYAALLAGWMRLVGLSPASGFFLNLACYVAFCGLIVRTCSPIRDRPQKLACAACLAPFSVAPALLVHGSQPLKDEAFVFLIGAVAVCVLSLLAVPESPAPQSERRTTFAALIGLGAAAYAMSGMRLYFVEMIWLCLGAASVLHVWFARKSHPGRAVAIGLVTLGTAAIGPGAVWIEASRAATTRPAPFERSADTRPSGSPDATAPSLQGRRSGLSSTGLTWASPLAQVRAARDGFQRAVGESNFAPESATDDPLIGSTMVGMAILFVPIPVIRWLGLAEIEGGRGLLFVTDIDTLLLDLSIAACGTLLVVRRKWIHPHIPYVCFTLGLALITTLLLAFVVTNFGTLFRLRLMMAVPFWMLPLATLRKPCV